MNYRKLDTGIPIPSQLPLPWHILLKRQLLRSQLVPLQLAILLFGAAAMRREGKEAVEECQPWRSNRVGEDLRLLIYNLWIVSSWVCLPLISVLNPFANYCILRGCRHGTSGIFHGFPDQLDQVKCFSSFFFLVAGGLASNRYQVSRPTVGPRHNVTSIIYKRNGWSASKCCNEVEDVWEMMMRNEKWWG